MIFDSVQKHQNIGTVCDVIFQNHKTSTRSPWPDSQETSILVCHAVRHSVRHFVTFVRHSHFEVSDFSLFIFRKVVNALFREDPSYLRFIVEPHPHFDEFSCVASHFDKVAAAHFREN